MEITRRQGRVVLVGYVKLDIHPKNFLYREIDLRYSRAYGPGSYHTGYEKGRLDYPFGYVRWTEKRNLAEFIRLVSSASVSLEPLIAGGVRPRGGAGRVRRHPAAARSAGSPRSSATAPRSPTGVARCDPFSATRRTGAVGISLIGFGNHVLGQAPAQPARDAGRRDPRDRVGDGRQRRRGRRPKVGATMVTTTSTSSCDDAGTDGVVDLLEPARALRAHPQGDRGGQGGVRREADGDAASSTSVSSSAAWRTSPMPRHARAQPALLAHGRSACASSIGGRRSTSSST